VKTLGSDLLGLRHSLLVVCALLLLVTVGVLGLQAQEATNMSTNPVNFTFKYILYGHPDEINVTLYNGAYTYFSGRDTHIYVGLNDDTYSEVVNNPEQDVYLKEVVDAIKSKSSSPEDQARIAVSLVQRMEYVEDNDNEVLYPYEVLYHNGGVCSGKSVLLAYLLKNIGYDTALLIFRPENHMAVGIKTDSAYAYKNTGYAFIETTSPDIITFSDGDYPNPHYDELVRQNLTVEELFSNQTIRLVTQPEVYPVSPGMAFTNLSKDYADAWYYADLGRTANGTASPLKYRQWQTLHWYYGLRYGDEFLTDNPLNQPLCNLNETYCSDQCWEQCPNSSVSNCTERGLYCDIPYTVTADSGDSDFYEVLGLSGLLIGVALVVVYVAINR
jgi:hypothetical protein